MKWKLKKFTLSDFKEADRVDRIYMSLIQPKDFELSDTDEKYLSALDKAYPIIKAKSEAEALNLIAHLEGGKWKNQIEEIYRDSMRLYDSFAVSKEVLKAIATKQLIQIAEDMTLAYDVYEDELAKAKAADVARRAWGDVMKYNRLDVEDAKAGELPAPPQMARFEIHPVYLNAQKAEIVD